MNSVFVGHIVLNETHIFCVFDTTSIQTSSCTRSHRNDRGLGIILYFFFVVNSATLSIFKIVWKLIHHTNIRTIPIQLRFLVHQHGTCLITCEPIFVSSSEVLRCIIPVERKVNILSCVTIWCHIWLNWRNWILSFANSKISNE